MLAPIITEVMKPLCIGLGIPPILTTDFSGPQYLVTFHTSNSRLCMIGMAVGTMAIIPLTHFLFLSLNSNLALLFCSSISSIVAIQPIIPNITIPNNAIPKATNIIVLMLFSPISYIPLLQFYNPFYLSHSK